MALNPVAINGGIAQGKIIENNSMVSMVTAKLGPPDRGVQQRVISNVWHPVFMVSQTYRRKNPHVHPIKYKGPNTSMTSAQSCIGTVCDNLEAEKIFIVYLDLLSQSQHGLFMK